MKRNRAKTTSGKSRVLLNDQNYIVIKQRRFYLIIFFSLHTVLPLYEYYMPQYSPGMWGGGGGLLPY